MTRAADCFAVAVPHDGEGHRSVYFSLFGRDLRNGESLAAQSRLVIARDVTPPKAVELYHAFARKRPRPEAEPHCRRRFFGVSSRGPPCIVGFLAELAAGGRLHTRHK